jgi:hypothetical protein
MSLSLVLLAVATVLVSATVAVLKGIDFFSAAGSGFVLGRATVDYAITILVAMIPAGIYWLVRRRQMPRLSVVIWSVWIVITLAMLIKQ